MRTNRDRNQRRRRRGAIAVTAAVTIPVLLAFAALSVDVGVMYNARADLQRAADAAALSAASSLTTLDAAPLNIARQTAKDTALANPCLNSPSILSDSDIVFGRANINPVTHQVSFTPTLTGPDSVRVTVRKTSNSPNGALPLYFARIFGRTFTEVEATATAAIAPRDIAVVSDISGSLVYDSEFRNWDDRIVNNYEVWDELPGGAGDSNSTWLPAEVLSDPAQSAGPAYGYFKKLGYGDDPADQDNYSVSSDPGLVRLRRGQTWSNSQLTSYLTAQQYSAAERSAIMNTTSTSNHENRVALALGLATWNSGMSGGRWSKVGVPSGGNNNTTYSDNELTWVAPYLSTSASSAQSIWRDYIDHISDSDSDFPDRYGVKTMLDYTLEHRRTQSETPELANVPVQPMEAVKEATKYMVNLLVNAQSFDQMSLEVFSTGGSHRVDLSTDFDQVGATLDAIVPTGSTNMGIGLELGIDELTSDRARSEAKKVLLLITDGEANVGRNGQNSTSAGKQYALEEAQRAADLGIEIVTISVGQDADQTICAQMAAIGGGVHFHAGGSIEEYSDQLLQIFAAVGGRRTVELIEQPRALLFAAAGDIPYHSQRSEPRA